MGKPHDFRGLSMSDHHSHPHGQTEKDPLAHATLRRAGDGDGGDAINGAQPPVQH